MAPPARPCREVCKEAATRSLDETRVTCPSVLLPSQARNDRERFAEGELGRSNYLRSIGPR